MYFSNWLNQVLAVSGKLLVEACGIYFPDQVSTLGPLHWECRLATGPPGKPQLFFFLVLLGPHCWAQTLWLVGGVVGRVTLPCSVWASYCSGFSCCRTQAVGSWASAVAARMLSNCGSWALEHWLSHCGTCALVPLQHVGISQTKDQTHDPSISSQILNH